MADIELIYFGCHGRAFMPRMLFKLAEVEFKDTRVTGEEFAKMKCGNYNKKCFSDHNKKLIFSTKSDLIFVCILSICF